MRKHLFKQQKRLMFISLAVLAFVALAITFTDPIAGLSFAVLPIFGMVASGTFKELTPDKVAELSVEDQILYFAELQKHKAKQLEDFKEQLKQTTTEELQLKIKELRDEMTADKVAELKIIKEALKEQGIALRKLASGEPVTRDTFAEYLDKNKSLLIKMSNGQHGKDHVLVIKADTLRASVSDSKMAYIVPDIGQLATKKLTLYDLFAKIPVGPGSGGKIDYYDWDEATTTRAAAVLAEGGTFPESTAKWKWYSLPLQKVGDIIPLSEEFDQDMPQFAAELQAFIEVNVSLIVDTELYSGDGTGSHLTGVYTAANTYTAVPSGITDASIYDLIVDVKRDITAGKGSKYNNVNFALMNSSDIIKYKLKKDLNNNYVMPPFVTPGGQTVDGILVIETSTVTANTMLIGDNRFAKIYEVEGITVTPGYATGDFESDMKSLKVKQRLAIVVKNADKGAFRKVTSISAALALLAT